MLQSCPNRSATRPASHGLRSRQESLATVPRLARCSPIRSERRGWTDAGLKIQMSFFSFVKISILAKSRTQNSNANQNEMTQLKRNFGTKALRRDGVRGDTQGGRAL